MYAIIENAGYQYKVSPGDTIKVQKLENDKGTEISIEQGTPCFNRGKYFCGYSVNCKCDSKSRNSG